MKIRPSPVIHSRGGCTDELLEPAPIDIRPVDIRPIRVCLVSRDVSRIGMGVAAVDGTGRKYPEPSVYPLPSAWYLTFKHDKPRRIVVDVPGQKVPTAYWYLTYTVTNNTNKEVEFLPDFEMVSDDGKVHPSDRHVPLPVFNAIKKSLGNDLLATPAQVAGALHQGEDQAKDSVAIWEEPLARMGRFSIFAGGLSSEFVFAKDNDGKPMNDADGKQLVLRKALEMDFVIYGDEIKPELDEVHALGEKWIMR